MSVEEQVIGSVKDGEETRDEEKDNQEEEGVIQIF